MSLSMLNSCCICKMNGCASLIKLSQNLHQLNPKDFMEIITIEFEYDGCQQLIDGFIRSIYQLGDNYSSQHIQTLLSKCQQLLQAHNDPAQEKVTTDNTCKIENKKSKLTLDIFTLPDDILARIVSFLPMKNVFKTRIVATDFLLSSYLTKISWDDEFDDDFYQLIENIDSHKPKYKIKHPMQFDKMLLNDSIKSTLLHPAWFAPIENNRNKTPYTTSQTPMTLHLGMFYLNDVLQLRILSGFLTVFICVSVVFVCLFLMTDINRLSVDTMTRMIDNGFLQSIEKLIIVSKLLQQTDQCTFIDHINSLFRCMYTSSYMTTNSDEEKKTSIDIPCHIRHIAFDHCYCNVRQERENQLLLKLLFVLLPTNVNFVKNKLRIEDNVNTLSPYHLQSLCLTHCDGSIGPEQHTLLANTINEIEPLLNHESCPLRNMKEVRFFQNKYNSSFYVIQQFLLNYYGFQFEAMHIDDAFKRATDNIWIFLSNLILSKQKTEKSNEKIAPPNQVPLKQMKNRFNPYNVKFLCLKRQFTQFADPEYLWHYVNIANFPSLQHVVINIDVDQKNINFIASDDFIANVSSLYEKKLLSLRFIINKYQYIDLLQIGPRKRYPGIPAANSRWCSCTELFCSLIKF